MTVSANGVIIYFMVQPCKTGLLVCCFIKQHWKNYNLFIMYLFRSNNCVFPFALFFVIIISRLLPDVQEQKQLKES